MPLAAFLLLALAAAPPERTALDAARRRQLSATARADALDAAAARATDRADRLVATTAALALRVQAGEAAVAAGRMRLEALDAQRRQTALRIAAARAPLARLLAAQARIARRPLAVALIEQRSIDDTNHIRALLAVLEPQIAAGTAAMRADLGEADRLRAAAARTLAGYARERELLARRRAALAAAEAASRQASLALHADAETSRAEALRLAAHADTLEELLARAARGATASARLASLPDPLPRLADPAAAPPPPSTPATLAPPSLYRLPALGRVISGSGEAGANGFRSRGLTLAVTPGAQALAPAAGRVVYAGAFRKYDGVVIVDHGGGWTSLVAGLAPVTTGAGARLVGGSPIGRTGRTLLIELRHDGRPVDIARMAQALR